MKNSFSSVSKTSTSRALEAQYTKDDVRMTQSLINDFVQNAMDLENSVPAAQLKMTTTAAQAHEPSIPLDAANQLAGGAETHTLATVGTTFVAKKAFEFAGAVSEKHPWLR